VKSSSRLERPTPDQAARLTSALLLVLAAATVVGALLYRPRLFLALGAEPRVLGTLDTWIPRARLALVTIGLLLLLVGEWMHPRILRRRAPRHSAPSHVGPNLALVLVPVVWLASVAEIALRPFADLHPKSTTLFVRDEALGWKLRPRAFAPWGGVPVRVNERGLRGPTIDYRRSGNALRILYLGDSVTFGYKIADWDDTFPAVIERCLETRFGPCVETVNAGVGGYSPWQEWEFLRTEGLRYAPDIVVFTFVLNDVTEKNALVRFGGAGEGFHLENSYYSLYDRFTHQSSIGHFVESIRRRVRFGPDLRAGAIRQESRSVEDMILDPDDDRIVELWRITLENVEKIYGECAAADIPVVCVMPPYRFQLRHRSELCGPQRRVEAHAATNGVPFLDLVPALSRFESETRRGAWELYLDDSHLTAEGYEIMGRAVAEFLEETVLAGARPLVAAD
jgi:lysophospholipase L1-like esterase